MKIKLKVILPMMLIAAVLSTGFSTSAEEHCGILSYIVCPEGVVITGVTDDTENITIPGQIDGKTVVGIRENAFYKCDTLKSISIPHSVNKIGHHAFYGCCSLMKAEIDSDVLQIEEGCFSGCVSLKNIDISGNVTSIGKYCFCRCESLERVSLPDTVKEIDKYAFYDCSSLESIELPDRLVTVGEFAFYNCTKLLLVNIPESVSNIGSFAFGYYGKVPTAYEHFSVSGDEDSLGRKYAYENSFEYISDNDKNEDSGKHFSVLPVSLAIGAATGLVLHKTIEKTGRLKYRYEYEK